MTVISRFVVIYMKIYSKIEVSQSYYMAGKKYCRRCECHFITNKVFCPCCGMQLRTTPIERVYKQKLREGNREKLISLA
jgi:rRNA maturation endonuclease Nob1